MTMVAISAVRLESVSVLKSSAMETMHAIAASAYRQLRTMSPRPCHTPTVLPESVTIGCSPKKMPPNSRPPASIQPNPTARYTTAMVHLASRNAPRRVGRSSTMRSVPSSASPAIM